VKLILCNRLVFNYVAWYFFVRCYFLYTVFEDCCRKGGGINISNTYDDRLVWNDVTVVLSLVVVVYVVKLYISLCSRRRTNAVICVFTVVGSDS